MKKFAAFAAAALLSSCVAETVERRRPRKGPVKEVGFVELGGGHLRYSTDGWGWFISGRRRDAMRKMRKNCGKALAPQITDDYARQDTDISYSGEDITVNLDKGMEHFKIAPFQHLVYDCRPKGRAHVEPPRVSTASPRVILTVPPASAAPEPATESGVIDVPAVSTGSVPAQEPPQ